MGKKEEAYKIFQYLSVKQSFTIDLIKLQGCCVTASYGMTDTLGRMHSDAQFAGSSSVPAHVEMMGLIGAGNNPMVGMTVAVAVSVEEAADAGKF